jgi:hypothetical protein
VTDVLAAVPLNRVVLLPGADVDALARTMARNEAGPAVVVTRSVPPVAAAFVHAVEAELERAAVALLPGWLPEAASVDRLDAGGVAAVRLAAAGLARRAYYPRQFLTGLAVRALTGTPIPPRQAPLRTRLTTLTRVVGHAFGRSRLVLLAPLDEAGSGRSEVVAGAEWILHNASLPVWLVGDTGADVDRLTTVRLPPAEPDDLPPEPVPAEPADRVEAALERALAGESWAYGRRWNETYRSDGLPAPVRLDLVWPAERCVVELDGPEHCHPVRFEADRQRDVLLQQDGYAVLRFTTARVTYDVGAVVQQIGTFLRGRRRNVAGL